MKLPSEKTAESMSSKDFALKSSNMRMSRVQNLFSRSAKLPLETKIHWLFPGKFFKDKCTTHEVFLPPN